MKNKVIEWSISYLFTETPLLIFPVLIMFFMGVLFGTFLFLFTNKKLHEMGHYFYEDICITFQEKCPYKRNLETSKENIKKDINNLMRLK